MVSGIYNERRLDTGSRFRYMQALTEQLVKDHQDLCLLWESFKHGQAQFEDLNTMIRAVCWIRKELFDLMELTDLDIEGQISVEMNEIGRDLSRKSRWLDELLCGKTG